MNPISGISGYGSRTYISAASAENDMAKTIKNPTASKIKTPGKESSPAECETCNSRKYKDGSDENVSFKSATHIAPESAASKVRAHEQEHVNNAYSKAAKDNAKVMSANVAIHTSICPECGRSYVSGGTTSTQIKYYNEENPYQKNLKQTDAAKYKGRMIDIAC
ncbi:MAG: hypothetical protein IKW30_07855 [Lachnospiraceae bacterium]|nr:hypothetical protein [Lachnospiraceae bacterium]